MKKWRIGQAAVLALVVGSAGCAGGGKDTSVASSGDPEANQRAEQRVGSSTAAADAKDKTLFDRLGGTPGIERIVDDMVTRSINDPRVNFDRHDVKTSMLGKHYPEWEASPQNVEVLKQHMVEFLTLASGGPAQYTGRDVKEVHKGMRISTPEFDAMVGDVKASMDRLGYAPREKRDLLAVVETTRKQIVEK